IENSPKVLSAYNNYLSDREKVTSSGSLENLELKAGILPEAMMQVNGEQVATISVMQMFPWFGTLSAEKKEMECMSLSDRYFIDEYAEEIALDAARYYYELVGLQAEIKEIKAKIKLNKEKQESTLNLYTATQNNSTTASSYGNMSSDSDKKMSGQGNGMQGMNMGGAAKQKTSQKSDAPMQSMGMSSMGSMSSQSTGMAAILRLQSEEANLDNELTKLKGKYNQKLMNFAALLGEDNSDNIVIEDTLEFIGDDLSIKTFEQIAGDNAHLKMLALMSESYTAKAKMQKKMAYPMIGLGIEYMINRKTDMPKMESMNGKNMFMGMISVSVPYNVKKNKANVRSAEYERQSNEENIKQAILDMRLRYNEIIREKEDIMQDIAFYESQEKILNDILSLSTEQYASSSVSLNDIFSLQEELLQYRTKKIKAVADYLILQTEINGLTSDNIKQLNLSITSKQ
ncbi:MAG: TolC family protein, partial [Bacteroidales bacterium]|nr:TolC family protein [Bacteroidales bacterium]